MTYHGTAKGRLMLAENGHVYALAAGEMSAQRRGNHPFRMLPHGSSNGTRGKHRLNRPYRGRNRLSHLSLTGLKCVLMSERFTSGYIDIVERGVDYVTPARG